MTYSALRVRKDTYVDSVLLMRATRAMEVAAGVQWAAALMATPANLEIAPTWAKISAVFFAVFSTVFSAIESAFERGGEDRGEKIKERPMAADEKIGEADILSRYCQLAIVRERRGQESAPGRGVSFAFYSPNRVSLSVLPLSRRSG